MSHTKEPWRFSHNSWETSSIYGGEVGCLVAECSISADITGETQSQYEPIKEANARRIVACVNACAGIPDDMILHVIAFGMEGHSKATEYQQQRDKLLEALKAMINPIDKYGCGFESSSSEFWIGYDKAKSIIAEIEATK